MEKKAAKTDYYELLEVDKTATQKEIERGYKKAALKWHPDKNKDTDTTQKFQDISEAYTTLSDPNERAWYDDHRDQILAGKNTDDLTEEDFDYMTKSKLMPYFSNSCYSGFDARKEDNFYRVYGELFRQLDKEEEQEEAVGEEHYALPDFGDGDSTAEQVFRFYQYWQHFSTKKKFSYADKYNPNQAPNRRVKRIIDNENKKERQAERKEFNDTVVKLLEYVQKRDQRYQKFKLAESREKEAKKQKEFEEREKKRLEEQEKLRKYREEIAQKYAQEEEEALANGDFEEVTVEEFRCEVCKKVFKNEKQMDNHLQSKKHKDNYAKFKSTVELDGDTEELVKKEEEKKRQEEEEQRQKEKEEKLKELDAEKKQKTRKGGKKQEEDDEEDKEEQTVYKQDEEEEEYVSKNKLKKLGKQQPQKKGKQQMSSGATLKDQFGKLDKQEQDELYELIKQKEAKKQNAGAGMAPPTKQKGKKVKKGDDSDEDDVPILPKQQKQQKQPKKQKLEEEPIIEPVKEVQPEQPAKEEQKQEEQSIVNLTETEQKPEPIPTQEKKKLKGGAGKVQKEDEDEEFTELGGGADASSKSKREKRKEKKSKKEDDTKASDLKCNVCKEQFDTRNALFTHIKKTGHARAV